MCAFVWHLVVRSNHVISETFLAQHGEPNTLYLSVICHKHESKKEKSFEEEVTKNALWLNAELDLRDDDEEGNKDKDNTDTQEHQCVCNLCPFHRDVVTARYHPDS